MTQGIFYKFLKWIGKGVKKKKKQVYELCYDIETEGLSEFPEPETYDADLIKQTFADILDKKTYKKYNENSNFEYIKNVSLS